MLNLPRWKPLPYNTSWPKALQLCPKPWRYQTAEELDNGPIKTRYNSYEGGGYIAALGYDENSAHGVLTETIGYGWIDRRTRALILEFVVFNVNTNLISIATYIYEVIATGAAYTATKAETLELYSTESGALMFYLICQFLFMGMVFYYFIMMLINLFRQRFKFVRSFWNMIDLLMIVSSVASVVFYVVRSKSIRTSIEAIRANPYRSTHFRSTLYWARWENASIAVAIFMVTLKLLNLIRFNPYVIYLFSSFRQSIAYQLSYVGFFLIVFNAFVISGMQFFGRSVHAYSSYMQAVLSQFEFLLGKAAPLGDLRDEHPFLGTVFALMFMLTMTIFLLNMIVSVLNEAYAGAKANIEESAEDLQMARYIGESFADIFQQRKRTPELRLFCDDTTFVNMCRSDAEPFCLNSGSIIESTEERMEKMEKRALILRKRSETIAVDHLVKEDEFLDLLQSMASHSR